MSTPEAARKAAAYLREHDPRTPAEQAAIDAVRGDHLWMLWHADDYATGVILLLSRASLLRDAACERVGDATRQAMARISQQDRHADARAIADFDALAEQAANRLTAGEPAAEVAQWLLDTRAAIFAARDRRKSVTAETEAAE